MRILLTEDDPQLGRATQIGLEQGGYAVDWVMSAEHAHTAVRLHDYACILLDLGLPGQDGMQALGSLRDSGYGGAVLSSRRATRWASASPGWTRAPTTSS